MKMYNELDNMLHVGDIGRVKMYPFKHLNGSPWQNECWEMRLLNAGEILEIMRIVRGNPDRLTQDELQEQKLEMFIKSVVSRNGKPLVTQETTDRYNRDHKTDLTITEVARISVKNLEQYILNAWDAAYAVLMAKQENLVQGRVVCKTCGSLLPITTPELPPVEAVDEVPYCPSCESRQAAVNQAIDKISNDFKPVSGESLARDIDLGV